MWNKKKTVGWVLAVFIIIALVEAGLRLVAFAMHAENKFVDPRYLWSAHPDKEIARQFFAETWQATAQSTIRVQLRVGKEYHGKYVRVNPQGYRETWNPSTLNQSPFKTLYVYGGSTVWGAFAKDEATIPSHLSKMLEQKDYKFQVYNYGQSGSTFIPEILHLALLLRQGLRPDYVIFYEGANDLSSGLQNGKIAKDYDLTQKMEGYPEGTEDYWAGFWPELDFACRKILIYEGLRRIVFRLLPHPSVAALSEEYSDSQLRELAAGVVEDQYKSLNLLDNLSKTYGFRYLYFWQPLVYTKMNLAREEKDQNSEEHRFYSGDMEKLYHYSNEIISQKSSPLFFDFSKIFAEETKTVFLDFCHLTEEGNQKVAAEMFKVFENKFLQ